MPNHLAQETSPYLRQHQDNPVDWYPWGDEALTRAREENKPIFLSIGYAACHWCHVMAHESFEDDETADILNHYFISIKVDREERPDLDDIYMQAVVMLTGQGGWPMSVFLTPNLKPFYGGTYFPPSPRYGRPSFIQILQSVNDAWENKQTEINSSAQSLTDAIRAQNSHTDTADDELNLEKSVDQLADSYDWQNGGWGGAPKFPQPMVIEFLIQRGLSGNTRATELVKHNLEQMARGGMYDLSGGGFHRYSTDVNWLVPHFEKMLYDNAQLALAYLHGFSLTGNIFFRWVAENTLNFIQQALTHPDGGFYSSLDADTPEGEGRYYAWTTNTLRTHLSTEQFNQLQGLVTLTKQGNFEDGLNILQFRTAFADLAREAGLPETDLLVQLEPIFSTLRAIRAQRLSPSRDEKIITSWNALAVRAFAEAGMLLERPDYLAAARNAVNFILNNLQPTPGHLRRSWSQGKADQPGTLEDHAGMILGLSSLYQADFSPALYQSMQTIYQVMEAEFASEGPFYYDAAASVSNLIVRPRNLQDNATPSGNALAAHVHWLFGNFEHEPEHFNRLDKLIRSMSEKMNTYPTSFGYWLRIADLWQQPTQQIALVSNDTKKSLETYTHIYHRRYRPHSIIAAKFNTEAQIRNHPGLLANRPPLNGKPTAYICQNFTCLNPITDADSFSKELDPKIRGGS